MENSNVGVGLVFIILSDHMELGEISQIMFYLHKYMHKTIIVLECSFHPWEKTLIFNSMSNNL